MKPSLKTAMQKQREIKKELINKIINAVDLSQKYEGYDEKSLRERLRRIIK